MERTDGQLLNEFATRKDPEAFREILRRHQAMVMGVCRRVLGNAHDAEDAFQATFLALAQKAGSIRKIESLASWLFGVAFRVASLSRSQANRKRERELEAKVKEAAGRPGADGHERAWGELRPVLDEELNRLPEKYRAPLVLCYFEGKTNAKAAEALGWPSGTMSRRLAGARERLRDRLVRRGVAISGATLAALLSTHVAAAVPTAVVASTVLAAGQVVGGAPVAAVVSAKVGLLTKGGLNAMMWAKMHVAAAMVAATVAVSGGGVLAVSALTMKPQEPPAAAAKTSGPRGLKGEDLDRALALVRTSPGEARWDEIPWTTSLWEGRMRAAAEGKPLFIWAANGNPIGVT